MIKINNYSEYREEERKLTAIQKDLIAQLKEIRNKCPHEKMSKPYDSKNAHEDKFFIAL